MTESRDMSMNEILGSLEYDLKIQHEDPQTPVTRLAVIVYEQQQLLNKHQAILDVPPSDA